MKIKSLLIILQLIFLYSCNENKSTKIPENKVITNESKSYTFGKLYRDIGNKFRIQYPNNWDLVAGEAKHTVVKFINRDSSMSLSVNVMDNDGSMTSDKLSETQLNDYKTQLTSALTSANKPPVDMTVENGLLDNHNAVITSYKFLYRQIDVELLFQFYQIQSLKDGKIYNIILSAPKKYFSEIFKSYINNFLYSFMFDPE